MIQDVDRICEVILNHDFSEEVRNKSVIQFKNKGMDAWIYVRYLNEVPSLVLHPEHKSRLADFRNIEGVNHLPGKDTPWIHSSNLLRFPRRQHRGQGLIHYGLAFNFESPLSLDTFLVQLNEALNSSPVPNDSEDEVLTYEASRQLLEDFLNRWPMSVLEDMSLEDYVGVKNPDTFCQWIETKTRPLGSVKGGSSSKFGIYERVDSGKSTRSKDDDKYSWVKRFGDNRDEAFEKVKRAVLDVARYAEKGQFHAADSVNLSDMFKWKIAFLYSNERLIPIFKREVLERIARYYEPGISKRAPISEIQQILVSNKPVGLDVYSFMRELYEDFGSEETAGIDKQPQHRSAQRRLRKRKPALSRNTTSAKVEVHYTTEISRRHNKLQEALQARLVAKYGPENVVLEENFVDVKVVQPDYLEFYEVKSQTYASDCVKSALGQVLLYAHEDEDVRPKKLFIVGQYPASAVDKLYIDYIKSKLDMQFEYFHVDLL